MEKKNMKNRDKVIMLLTTRGISLEEGMKIYDSMMNSTNQSTVVIDRENDIVVWLDRYTTREGEEELNLTIWLNYRKDFCENYSLVGAFFLDDEELAMQDSDDKAAFMDFFRMCHNTEYNAPAPILPEELRYIFTIAAITEYMEYDSYEINDSTNVFVTSSAKPAY